MHQWMRDLHIGAVRRGIIPGSIGGRKKLSPVNEALKVGTVLEDIRFARLQVTGHMMC